MKTEINSSKENPKSFQLDRMELREEIRKFHNELYGHSFLVEEIIFNDDSIFNITDWKWNVEYKKKHFWDRINTAPKSKRLDIYLKELNTGYELDEHEPELEWTLETLSYSLANEGRNYDISKISFHYFNSSILPNLFNSKIYSFEKNGVGIYYYSFDLFEVLPRITDGISQAYYIDYLNGLDKNQFIEKQSQPEVKNEINIFPGVEWTESKTDLAELIKALWLSERIKLDGKPIQQKDLIPIFEKLFSVDLKSFYDLFRESKNSHKKFIDGQYFTGKLFDLVKKDIEKDKANKVK